MQEEQQNAQMRVLKIKTLNNQIFEVKVPASMLVKDLKVKVEEVSEVPRDRQRMICMGQQLQDQNTVGHYAKEEVTWIHLVAKVQPPAATPAQQNSSVPTNPQAQQPPQPQQTQQPPQQQNEQHNRPFNILSNVQFQSNNIGEINSIIGNLSNVLGSLRVNQNPSSVPSQQTQVNAPQAQNNTVIQNVQPNLTFPLNSVPLIQNPSSSTANRSNLIQSSQPITLQRQIQLPHQELLNLGLICNNLMGNQSSFPGPPLPQLSNRNPAQLLGSYLSNWQFQVQRTLPFVHRLAELLQREPQLTSQEDRNSTQALSLEVGRALNELVASTQPVTSILRDLVLHPSPGAVRFQQSSTSPAPILTRPQPQQFNSSTNNNSNSNNINNNNSSNTNNSINRLQTQTQQPQNQQPLQRSQQPPSVISQPQQQQPQTQSTQQQPQNQNQTQTQPSQPSQPQQRVTNQQSQSQNPFNDLLSQLGGGQNQIHIVVDQGLSNGDGIQVMGIQGDGAQGLQLQNVLQNFLGQVGSHSAQLTINASTIQAQPQQNSSDQDGEVTEVNISLPINSTVNNQTSNVSGSVNLNTNNQSTTQNISSNANQNENADPLSGANLFSILQNIGRTSNIGGTAAVGLMQAMNTAVNSGAFQNISQAEQPSQSQVQQQQQQQQQQSEQIQGQPEVQQPVPINPLQLLMGQQGLMGSIMSMTIEDLSRENQLDQEETSEEEQIIMNIIGSLPISDLMSCFVSGQFSFLDVVQNKIRQEIEKKNINNRTEFSERVAQSIANYLIVPEQLQDRLYEGIQPEGIAQDILEERLPALYDLIFRDFQPDGLERFSSEFVYEIRNIIGVLFSDLAECFQNGLNDLEVVFRHMLNEQIVRVMGESAAIVSLMVPSMIWDKIKREVLIHQHQEEQRQAQSQQAPSQQPSTQQQQPQQQQQQLSQQQQQQGEETKMEEEEIQQFKAPQVEDEVDLLEDIENGLQKDQDRYEKYKSATLSDEYKKGEINDKKGLQ